MIMLTWSDMLVVRDSEILDTHVSSCDTWLTAEWMAWILLAACRSSNSSRQQVCSAVLAPPLAESLQQCVLHAACGVRVKRESRDGRPGDCLLQHGVQETA
jgi:hypothetical protein